jgi:uncharacterized membrane protein YjfL (UPF0719 family)
MHLDSYLLSDLLATIAFGLVAIALIIFGYMAFDKLTPRLDFSDLLHKGNMALAVVMGAFILGLCHVVASVISTIRGGP